MAARAFAAKRPTERQARRDRLQRRRQDPCSSRRPNKRKIKAALAATPQLGEGTEDQRRARAGPDVLTSTGATVRSVVLLSDGADVGSKSKRRTSRERPRERQGARLRGRAQVVGVRPVHARRAPRRRPAAPTWSPRPPRSLRACSPPSASSSGTSTSSSTGRSRRRRRTSTSRSPSPGSPAADAQLHEPGARRRRRPSFHKSTFDRIVQSPLSVILLVVLILLLLAYAVSKLFSLRGRSFRSRMSSFVDFDDDDDTGVRRDEIRAALADADYLVPAQSVHPGRSPTTSPSPASRRRRSHSSSSRSSSRCSSACSSP